MKNVLRISGSVMGVLMVLASVGCSSGEMKLLLMNQLVGIATAITSAIAVTLINSLFAGAGIGL